MAVSQHDTIHNAGLPHIRDFVVWTTPDNRDLSVCGVQK